MARKKFWENKAKKVIFKYVMRVNFREYTEIMFWAKLWE